MWFGWKDVYIDNRGMPTDIKTDWHAICFILFTHIIYIGEVKRVEK